VSAKFARMAAGSSQSVPALRVVYPASPALERREAKRALYPTRELDRSIDG
jgi:hypothetical protein